MMMVVENNPWKLSVRSVIGPLCDEKLLSRMEFITQWAFYSFFVLIDVGFSQFFSWPRWLIDLKHLQACQFMVDYIKCFQQLFSQQKPIL